MKTIKVVHGYCPTLGKEHSIDIEFIDVSDLSSDRPKYLKGLFECSVGSYGKCPIVGDCPVNKLAPENI